MEVAATLLCVLCPEIIVCEVRGNHPHHGIQRAWIFLNEIAQQSTVIRTQCYIGVLDEIIYKQCGSASCFSQGAQDDKRDGTLIPFNELKPSLRILLSAQPS